MICCESIENTSATTRELARRLSGTEEIVLLWYPIIEQVAICIHDLTTGVSFHLEVARGRAIDAFYHPYVYLAAHEHE